MARCLSDVADEPLALVMRGAQGLDVVTREPAEQASALPKLVLRCSNSIDSGALYFTWVRCDAATFAAKDNNARNAVPSINNTTARIRGGFDE